MRGGGGRSRHLFRHPGGGDRKVQPEGLEGNADRGIGIRELQRGYDG
eukprot:gene6022-22941_t